MSEATKFEDMLAKVREIAADLRRQDAWVIYGVWTYAPGERLIRTHMEFPEGFGEDAEDRVISAARRRLLMHQAPRSCADALFDYDLDVEDVSVFVAYGWKESAVHCCWMIEKGGSGFPDTVLHQVLDIDHKLAETWFDRRHV